MTQLARIGSSVLTTLGAGLLAAALILMPADASAMCIAHSECTDGCSISPGGNCNGGCKTSQSYCSNCRCRREDESACKCLLRNDA